jgi:hypothetical protein
MNRLELLSKKKFCEVSGVSNYIDEKVKIKLNEIGLYEKYVYKNINKLNPLVEKCSPYLNVKLTNPKLALIIKVQIRVLSMMIEKVTFMGLMLVMLLKVIIEKTLVLEASELGFAKHFYITS